MSNEKRNRLSEIMCKAWYMVKHYGLSMSDALKRAWAWFRLRAKMQKEIVEFWFVKSDGTKRQAFGTLRSDLLPETKGESRRNYEHLQTYFDTEKGEFRCFKIVNLSI